MATIYDYETGNELTTGVPSAEALDTACRMAAERGGPVTLEDDDGEWTVWPDGECERA